MRRVLLVAACLALATVAWFWFAGARAPGRHTRRASELLPVRVEESASAAEPRPEPSPALEPDGLQAVGITGSVVVIDEQGTEHTHESGRFSLKVWEGAGETHKVVTVSDGAFAFRAHPASRLSIGGIQLGGRAVKTEFDRLRVPADRNLELRVVRRPLAMLRVVDADRGNDLDEVWIVRDVTWEMQGNAHPGSARTLPVVTDGRSPLELPAAQGTCHYWVRANGFAWMQFNYDHTAGGERLVKLQEAGAVAVRLINFDPQSGAVVRFRHGNPGDPLSLEARPNEHGRFTIEHIAPGIYEARVEIGAWHDSPRVLGRGRVRVEPGVLSELEIALDDTPDRGEPVLLRGTLNIPEAWTAKVESLGIEAVGPDRAERAVDRSVHRMPKGDEGELRWNVGRLLPGRYVIVVRPFQFRLAVTVPEGVSEHVVRIELPAPATLTVEVVRAVNGQAVKVKGLDWHTSFRPGTGGGLESVSETPASKFTFQVPSDRFVYLGLDDPAFSAEDQKIDIQPGRNFAKLEVRPVFRFRLVVKDGNATIPVGHGFGVSLEHLDGDRSGKVAARWSNDTTSTFHMSAPGRYRLKFGRLKGYRPLTDKVVELSGAEVQEVVVRVERKE